MSEEIKEKIDGTLEQGEFKVKKKPGRPKKLIKKNEPVKLDLSKKVEEQPVKEVKDAVQESSTKKVDVRELSKDGGEMGKGNTQQESTEKPSGGIIEEIINEEVKEKPIEKPIESSTTSPTKTPPPAPLPENVNSLIDFMRETGGSVIDYARLNADYSNTDNDTLLKEYYKNTKPHLNQEEIGFIMEDQFDFDEDVDEEREVRKRKLAYKEEIAKAKNFLEDLKSKYYKEIKLRPNITQEQQKATDFFNRYNEEQEIVEKRHQQFKDSTKDYFTEDFKGFEFNLGEKKFRYGVNNPDDVANAQSNINNFVKTFLDENGNVTDYNGYHKAIYAARNADTIAQHFYEQGKTDAVKDVMAKSKNISNDPRPSSNGEVFINGLKVRAISGVDSSRLKIKKRK